VLPDSIDIKSLAGFESLDFIEVSEFMQPSPTTNSQPEATPAPVGRHAVKRPPP
jgi:hypothetical protein